MTTAWPPDEEDRGSISDDAWDDWGGYGYDTLDHDEEYEEWDDEDLI